MSTRKHTKFWTHRKMDWVDGYWNPEHPHREMIKGILQKHRPGSMLEVGCGAGANLFMAKRLYPELKIAGCDINADAIATAKSQFEVNKHLIGEYDASKQTEQYISPAEKILQDRFGKSEKHKNYDIEFKVGNVLAIPFNGDSYDLVLTDACLIYLGYGEIDRALREIRRVGFNKFMFVEFHSESVAKRLGLKLTGGYYAYNYKKILAEHHFKHIKIQKIPKRVWPGQPWQDFGFIITCVR